MNRKKSGHRCHFRLVVGITLAIIVILTGCNLEPDLSSVGQGSTSGAGGRSLVAEEIAPEAVEIIGENGTFTLSSDPGQNEFPPDEYELYFPVGEATLYIAILQGAARSFEFGDLSDPLENPSAAPWINSDDVFNGWPRPTGNVRLIWFTHRSGVSRSPVNTVDLIIAPYTPQIWFGSETLNAHAGWYNGAWVFDSDNVAVEAILDRTDEQLAADGYTLTALGWELLGEGNEGDVRDFDSTLTAGTSIDELFGRIVHGFLEFNIVAEYDLDGGGSQTESASEQWRFIVPETVANIVDGTQSNQLVIEGSGLSVEYAWADDLETSALQSPIDFKSVYDDAAWNTAELSEHEGAENPTFTIRREGTVYFRVSSDEYPESDGYVPRLYERTVEFPHPEDAIPVSKASDLQAIGGGGLIDGLTAKPDGYYFLTNDIDLGDSDPIDALLGSIIGDVFSGELHGDGHRIIGLNISVENVNNVGLFSELDGAVITRLSFEDANVEAPDGEAVGVLAGFARGVTITDVSVRGEVSGHREVGGLIGRIDSNSSDASETFRLEGIEIEAEVSGTGSYVGGTVGRVFESAPEPGRLAGVLDDIVVRPRPETTATPHIKGDGGAVGGIIGRLQAGSVPGPGVYEMRNVRSYVDVEGGQYVGAIVGQARSTEIVDAQVGSVGESLTVTSITERAGAIVGYSNHLIIRGALLSGEISVAGVSRIGGFVGRTDDSLLEIDSPAINGLLTVTGNSEVGAIVGSVHSDTVLDPSNLHDPEVLGLSEDDIEVIVIDSPE